MWGIISHSLNKLGVGSVLTEERFDVLTLRFWYLGRYQMYSIMLEEYL